MDPLKRRRMIKGRLTEMDKKRGKERGGGGMCIRGRVLESSTHGEGGERGRER